MEHVCYIPGHETFDKINNGEVRAFLLEGDRDEPLPDQIRLKPWRETFSEDEIRRMVRRGVLPMNIRLVHQEVTSIFALSSQQLRILGVDNRVECLDEVRMVHPDANMHDPFTFVVFTR